DVDSSAARGPEATDGDTLAAHSQPDIQDVVRASQGTLQNMDALLKRLDHIVAFIESGQGSIGKVIYDPSLYDRLNATVTEFKGLMDDIQSGKGSLGPLLTSDEAYKKAIAAIDKLNAIVDDLQQGKGSAGKALKDPALYDNANKTLANVRQLTDDINAGKGALGKMTVREQMNRDENAERLARAELRMHEMVAHEGITASNALEYQGCLNIKLRDGRDRA
ncbi:MAG: hypothetical protein ACLPSO_06965, partial [Terracidiphilus sp.]